MRARNVKPSLFKNELLATSDPLNTWIFEGLWCLADREGRLEDRPRRIHLEVNPGRAFEGTEASLAWLESNGFIVRYADGSNKYIQVVNFSKHQKPHMRELPSVIPPPNGFANRYNHEPVTEDQLQRIFARDGVACVRCRSTTDLHVDHITPISQGGTSDDSNLQTLCQKCNLGKGSALPRHDAGNAKAMSGPALSPSLIPDSPSLMKDMAAKRPFVRFWEAYPKKVKKKDSEKVWQAKRLDSYADALIADVARRLTEDRRWLGGFVPDPPTYLRGERWNDAIESVAVNGSGQHAADVAAKEHAQILDLASMFGLEQGDDDWPTFKARVDRANERRLASIGR